MKLIQTDNYNRDNIDEVLIAENITNEAFAKTMKEALNEKFCGEFSPFYCKIVPDEYELKEYDR